MHVTVCSPAPGWRQSVRHPPDAIVMLSPMKTLILAKNSWATVSGLCMSSCPLLHRLDVSWTAALKEDCFEDLLTPPVDRRPAMKNVSRLHRLRYLNLAGTEISDKY